MKLLRSRGSDAQPRPRRIRVGVDPFSVPSSPIWRVVLPQHLGSKTCWRTIPANRPRRIVNASSSAALDAVACARQPPMFLANLKWNKSAAPPRLRTKTNPAGVSQGYINFDRFIQEPSDASPHSLPSASQTPTTIMTNNNKYYQDGSKPKHGASKRDSKTQPSSSPSGHGGQHRSKKEDINPNRPSREQAYDPRDYDSVHAEAGSTGQYIDPRRAHEFGLNRHAQAIYAQEHPGA
ncbi:hypothetical protein Cob_v005707 [Colletotrichum orbiculare MAFF 240422]|uniref:Uncharacterized protein n=1 Tax=Colletotrichum orbiculare (strain 104-T / ATCC 96160 / CBS 514.97 / LARS 414 / MAFF 240422) TaxID=1213857 RepID=A0A484FSU6_COLOR|nr:hypothetical protein Cob_v005707 [Colletotrichum orbiculare MAFF 240422]